MSNPDGEFDQLPVRARQRPTGPPARPVGPETPPPGGLKRDYAGLLEYWQMIRRHQVAVILLIVVGGVIGYLLTLPQPRMYQARTTLEIQGLNQDFLNMKNVNPTMTPTSADYPQFDIETQVKILQSRAILNRTTSKLQEDKETGSLQPPDRLSAWRKALHLPAPTPEQLWQQAVGMAAGNLKVRSSGTNRIVEVSCSSTNPKIAANFINTLALEYIEENLEARWKTTEYTGKWLTKQLQDLKIKLERAEDELQGYARATGLVITDEKTNVDESKLADLQKELSSARGDRMTKQSKWELLANSPADALPQVLDDAELQASRTKLAELRQQLAQLRITYTPNHPEVQKVAAQIKTIEDGLEKQRTNILARIRNEYQGAKRREDMLAAAYNTQSRRVSDEAEKTTHYNLLKREVDTNRTLYETMLQTLKEASISSALRASNIRVVDVAEAPGAPFAPDVSRSVIAGLLIGTFLGIGFSVLRERADRTLQDPGDPTFYLKLPELGVIPASVLDLPQNVAPSMPKLIDGKVLANGNGHGNGNGNGKGHANGTALAQETGLLHDSLELVSWNRKSSLLAESFRTTLTSILFSNQDGKPPAVLVVTSASPKEGKTSVTSNLGIAAADIKRRVLLIDADLRRPRLHKVFHVDNSLGLSDLLHEGETLDAASLLKAVRPTEIPRLSVLASGGSRHSVSSLLYSDRLPELLRIARSEFDMVVIDTPPMVNISDARVLARHGDALILVVRSGVTTRDAALLAKQRFMDDGVNMLGIILNGWNPKTPGYGYYRYYYAGYYHYYGKTTAEKEA